MEAVFKKVCHQWKTYTDAYRDGYQTDPGAKQLKISVLTNSHVIGFSNSTGDRKIKNRFPMSHSSIMVVLQTFVTDSCDVNERPAVSVTLQWQTAQTHRHPGDNSQRSQRTKQERGDFTHRHQVQQVLYIFWQKHERSVTKPNKSSSCTGGEM